VFEDLHWVDTETQGLLDALIDSLPTARILLLVNFRPEYRHGWGSKTYYTQIRLDPLPAESAEALLDWLLGEVFELAPIKRLLVERTEGVPFFSEESVRTLIVAIVGEPGVGKSRQRDRATRGATAAAGPSRRLRSSHGRNKGRIVLTPTVG